jgi:alpha-galactosidase
VYLAVWRVSGEQPEVKLPLAELKGLAVDVRCAYPQAADASEYRWNAMDGELAVRLPLAKTARLFEFRL